MAEKRWFEDWEREHEESKAEQERQENERRKLDEETALKHVEVEIVEPAVKKPEEPYRYHEGKHGQFSFFEVCDKKEPRKFPTKHVIPVINDDPAYSIENE